MICECNFDDCLGACTGYLNQWHKENLLSHASAAETSGDVGAGFVRVWTWQEPRLSDRCPEHVHGAVGAAASADRTASSCRRAGACIGFAEATSGSRTWRAPRNEARDLQDVCGGRVKVFRFHAGAPCRCRASWPPL